MYSPYSSHNNPGPPYYKYDNRLFQCPYYYQIKREEFRFGNRIGWALVALSCLLIGLTPLYTFFLQLIGYRGSPQFAEWSGIIPELYFLIIGSAYSLALFLPSLLYLILTHTSPAQVIPLQKVKLPVAFSCIFLGLGGCMLSNIPANYVYSLLEMLGFPQDNTSYSITNDPAVIVLYLLVIAVIPALFEEFIFRGVILSGLKRYGDGTAIIVSALLFSFFHGNFVQYPFAFLTGIIFAWIVLKTNNIWLTVIIHAMNNGFSAFLEILSLNVSEEAYLLAYTIPYYSFCILGIISLVYLSMQHKEFFRLQKGIYHYPQSSGIGCAILNPGVITFLVLSILEAFAILFV